MRNASPTSTEVLGGLGAVSILKSMGIYMIVYFEIYVGFDEVLVNDNVNVIWEYKSDRLMFQLIIDIFHF